MKHRISVIICTRDRAPDLRRALHSLTECNVPDALSWQVLIVDNGSTDDTADVIASFHDRLPLSSVYEAQPGLSHARNRSVRETEGDWAIWIDDDVVVSETWLTAYFEAIQRHPDAVVLGGVISPTLMGNPPPWLRHGIEFVQDAFAARSPRIAQGGIQPHTLPYGANFALAREVAIRHPFDVSLGRHPDRPLQGEEELDVIRKVLAAGGVGHWVPGAVVHHCIDPERQTEQYLNAYYRQSGYVAAGKTTRGIRSIEPLRLLNSLLRWLGHRLEYAVHRANLNRPRRARNLREFAWHSGYLKGCCDGLKNPRPYGISP